MSSPIFPIRIELVPLGIEKVLHYPGEPLAVKVGGLFVVSPPKPVV